MKAYRGHSIARWALEDRPREKLMNHGLGSLSNTELIAILIRSGSRDETAVELARRILHAAGNNLQALGKFSVPELLKFRGLGPAKALSIMAAVELGRRRSKETAPEREKISGSGDVYQYFKASLADLQHEEFWILLLNRANRILDRIRISQGGIAGTVIDARIILKHAIDRLATSIILCHNHPSGNLKPSEADLNITRKIRESCKTMDIQVLDHIIIGDQAYYSFSDEGII
jgi:DNA repair protein RadC